MASAITPEQIEYMMAHADQTARPQLIAATAICCSAAFIAVVLRFVARFVGAVGFGWDDLLIVVSLVFSFAYSIIMAVETRLGLGLHVIFLKPQWAHPLGAMTIGALSILPLATYAVKISILVLLGRIFATQEFKLVLKIFAVILTGYAISGFFAELFQCTPVGSQLTGTSHHCINWNTLFTALSWINAVFDLVLIVLPLPLIWNLQTNIRRKIQITSIFSIGLIAVVASFIRAGYSLKATDVDITYNDAFVAMWATVEVNVSIVTACMPNYGPLVTRLTGALPSTKGSSKGALVYDSKSGQSYQVWKSSKISSNVSASVTQSSKNDDHLELGPYANITANDDGYGSTERLPGKRY